MTDPSQYFGVIMGGIATSTVTIIFNQIRNRRKTKQENDELKWLLEEYPLHRHMNGHIVYPQRHRSRDKDMTNTDDNFPYKRPQ